MLAAVLVAILTATLGSDASASIAFDLAQWHPVGSPTSWVVADVDGDGVEDLITGENETLWCRLVRPDGSLGDPFAIASVVAVALAAGDVDGDRDCDVVVNTGVTGLVVVLLNDGSGHFHFAPGAFTSPDGAGPLACGDLNGDGRQDVVVGGTTVGTVSVALGRPDGSLESAGHCAVLCVAQDLGIGDVDGDGNPDVVATPAGYPCKTLSVCRGDGRGGLVTGFGSPLEGYGQKLMAVADFDRDARADVAITSFSFYGEDLTLMYGQADGSFRTGATLLYGESARCVGAGDVDEDGWPDVVIGFAWAPYANYGFGGVHVFMNDGAGELRPPVDYLTGLAVGVVHVGRAPSGNPLVFALQQYRGDFGPGRTTEAVGLEAISGRLRGRISAPIMLSYHMWGGRFATGGTLLLLSGADTVFSVGVGPSGLQGLPAARATGALVATTDIDGDGLDDLILSRADSLVSVLANGDGSFRPASAVSVAPWGPAWGGTGLVADLEGDATPDLLVIIGTPLSIPVHADGTFGAARVHPELGTPGAYALGDFDGDGRSELAALKFDGETRGPRLEIWSAGPDGAFKVAAVAPLPGPVQDDPEYHFFMRASDLDADGRSELVVVARYGWRRVVIARRGTDAWSIWSIEYIPSTSYVYDFVLADFDRDGLQDIALQDDGDAENLSTTTILRQGSDHSFAVATAFKEEYRVGQIETADFDGDGDPDLALLNFNRGLSLVFNSSTPGAPISVAEVDAQPGRVRLLWRCDACPASPVRVERCSAGAAWTACGAATGDGQGRLVFEDTDVTPGSRIGYRLASPTDARLATASETWVDVPLAPRFALERLAPNPADGMLRIAFALERNAPARLELLDVAGRRVLERPLAWTAGGRGTLDVAASRLPAGLYFVRLTQGAQRATGRVVIAH